MKTSNCYIAGAGEYTGLVKPGLYDFIIAADGGYAELVSRGITPDLVVGDFDSLGEMPDHPNIVNSPAEKDDTDMLLAVKEGLARGFKTFVIEGGLSGRLDHTIANFQMLIYLVNNDARGILLGRDICVTAVRNGCLEFDSGHIKAETSLNRGVSVFSAGDTAAGVSLTGLKYPLDNATVTFDHPIGVSNEFTGAPARICVSEGTLIVTWTGGPELLVM